AIGLASGAGEPTGEVLVDAFELGATAPITDVAVGPHEVPRRAVDAEPRERLPVAIMENAGYGFASQPVHRDEAAVPLLQRGGVDCVAAVGWSAEEEVKARRGHGVL